MGLVGKLFCGYIYKKRLLSQKIVTGAVLHSEERIYATIKKSLTIFLQK